MRVIMLSPPGAGKGTQGALLSGATGVAHVSSGSLLRAEIERATPLGRRLVEYSSRGDLVPDDLLLDIVVPALEAAARETGGFILDGFPRTMAQALRVTQLGVERGLVIDVAVYLTAPQDVLERRMLSRAQQEGRADDTPEVIRHRFDIYREETEPLVGYYRDREILVVVDADRAPTDVQADLVSQLTARGVLDAGAIDRP
jgi:adenylate kinase